MIRAEESGVSSSLGRGGHRELSGVGCALPGFDEDPEVHGGKGNAARRGGVDDQSLSVTPALLPVAAAWPAR